MDESIMQSWKAHFDMQKALQEELLKSEMPRLQAALCRKLYTELKAQGFSDEQSLDLVGVLLSAGAKTGGV